jgi:hypothetical protein
MGATVGVESADDSDSSESGAIVIGDDFPHQWAQFEIGGLVGDSYIQPSIIESNNSDFVVTQYLQFRREFIQDRMQDNY